MAEMATQNPGQSTNPQPGRVSYVAYQPAVPMQNGYRYSEDNSGDGSSGAPQYQATSSGPQITQQEAKGFWASLCDDIGAAWNWVTNEETWKSLGEGVKNLATTMWNQATNTASEMWKAICDTVSDPQKFLKFLGDCASGKVLLETSKAVLNVVSNVVQTFLDITGIKDLGTALGCALTGDFQGAWNHLKQAGLKVADFVGITNLVNFVTMYAEGMATDNKELRARAWGQLGLGIIKIASVALGVAGVNATIVGARALATTFIYREVGQAATAVCFKEVAKDTFAVIAKSVTKEEFEAAGTQAAKEVGKSFEKGLVREVEKVAGRGTMQKAGAFSEETIAKVQTALKDGKVLSRLEREVAESAEKSGYDACKTIFELTEERTKIARLKVCGKELFGKRSLQSGGEELAELGRDNAFERIKKLSQEELEEMVRVTNASMDPAKVKRTAEAVRHMSEERWHFGMFNEEGKIAAKEAFADDLTDKMLDGGLRDGFENGWVDEAARIESRFGQKGIKLSEDFMKRFKTVAEDNFESGVNRACRELADKLFKEDDENFSKQNLKTSQDARKKKTVEEAPKVATVASRTDIPNKDFTIEAGHYGKAEEKGKKARTNEDVLADIDKDKERMRIAYRNPHVDVTETPKATSGAAAPRETANV